MKTLTRKKQQYMERLKDRLWEDADVESGYHSKSYHRFFEGYAEYQQLKPNGKTRVVRTYVADYYALPLDKRGRMLLKTLYGVLTLVILLLFLLAALPSRAANLTWFVVLSQILCVPILALTLMGVGRYILAPENMTIYTYNSTSKFLKSILLWGVVVFFLAAAISILYAVLRSAMREVLAALAYMGGAALYRLMWKLECNLEYRTVENPAKHTVPEDASVID